jgi:heparanase 1
MKRRRVGNAVFVQKGRAGKITLIVAGAVLALLLLLVTLALWGSRGWLPAFIAGQFGPAFEIPSTAVIDEPQQPAASVFVSVDHEAPIATVAARDLSFAIDLSQVTGGKWWDPDATETEEGSGTVPAPIFDFSRRRLDAMVSALGPSYLRVGGSESDKIYYDMSERAIEAERVPDGYESVLTGGQWDALNEFARRNDLRVVFTLNAGPSARDENGDWDPSNARELVEYTVTRDYPVEVWELGNEVNNFWYVFGVGEQINARQYHEDSLELVELLNGVDPDAQFGGQGGMIWPVFGEPLGLFFGMSRAAIRRNAEIQDVVSWHYYPQQSRRGPIASRRANPARLLDPNNLDEAAHWAEYFDDARDEYIPNAPLWVGETGNAQFGGEPGLSDVYLGGLWWLDQLGLLAQREHAVVIRQSLTGMNYGLIDERTLAPRPDYWNSILWERFMGREVLAPTVEAIGETSRGEAAKVRVYAHRSAEDEDDVSYLAINLHHDREAEVEIDTTSPVQIYQLTAPDIYGREVLLNGVPFRLDASGAPQEWVFAPVRSNESRVVLPPLSYAFVVAEP